MPATSEQGLCYLHDPNRAEERRVRASRAAKAKNSNLHRDLRSVRVFIYEVVEAAASDELPLAVKRNLTDITQLLQAYVRAAELEVRIAEHTGESINPENLALPKHTRRAVEELKASLADRKGNRAGGVVAGSR